MFNTTSLITVTIVTLVLVGCGYIFGYFVKRLKNEMSEKKVLRYVIIFFSWIIVSIISFFVAISLTYMLGKLLYVPTDITECFSSSRTELMRVGCIERHVRDTDDIAICNSIEETQIREGLKKENEYFIDRDRCVLTLVGFYYRDTNKLKHREWCYELSPDKKMADGRSLINGCLSKFEQ